MTTMNYNIRELDVGKTAFKEQVLYKWLQSLQTSDRESNGETVIKGFVTFQWLLVHGTFRTTHILPLKIEENVSQSHRTVLALVSHKLSLV